MIERLKSIFKTLGFAESEYNVYSALLEHGASTAGDVCTQTRLSRQTIYNALETLVAKGLVVRATRHKKRFYSIGNAEQLSVFAHRKELELSQNVKEITRMLPELKLKQGGEQPSISIFEGKDAALTVLTDLVHSRPKEVYEIADLAVLFNSLLDKEIELFVEQLKKNNTFFHGIYSGTPRGKSLRSSRYFLPKELSGFASDILLYDDKIVMITFKGKVHSVIIENKALASTLKILFTLAFEGAKAKKYSCD